MTAFSTENRYESCMALAEYAFGDHTEPSNHKLAKHISDSSFYEIRRQLEYKAKWYGKELVVIKETKSLEEIRMEYRKKQDSYSFKNKERNLLLAMNEIGNSEKNEYQFKEELNRQLNSSLFVMDAELSPAQEKILDYFGDFNGLFNSINFKEEISSKCIKDLIDLPSPKTGKPPKEFEELLSNIMSINKIFRNNPNRENYIETARTYINIRYQKIVPEE